MKRAVRRMRANYYYLRKPLRQFMPLAILLALVLISGSFAFHEYYQQKLSYLRALYITYCLVFNEHLIDFPSHWLLQAFYFLLPPFGFVVIVDGLVRFGYHLLRFDETSDEWIRAMAKTYSNHVVLCGLGRVGLRALEQLLKLGEDVVVLEMNPNNPNLAFARKHGVPVLIGNGREEGIMNDLHVSAAKSIILATDDDLSNLEMGLDARKINPTIRLVLRMFDQELAEKIRESFNIQLAFSTAAQSAPLIATSSADASIINSFYLGQQLIVVARLTVTRGAKLVGKRLDEMAGEHHSFVLSHRRGEEELRFPPQNMVLMADDTIVVQTEPHTLRFLHKLNEKLGEL